MRGFSLIEAVITIAIFSIVFFAVFNFMTQGIGSWRIADTNIDLQQEPRRALMVIDRHLRQSRGSKLNIPPDDNYYTSIAFKIPKDTDNDGDVIDPQGNIEWSGDITYSLNINKQIIRTDADGTSVMANDIAALQFRRLSGNPNIVEVEITAQKETAPGKTSNVSMGSMIKVRN